MISGSRDKKVLGEILQYRFGYAGEKNGITIRMWDVETGELLQTFNGHSNDVNFVSYSKAGDFIASASVDQSVNIWELPIPMQ